MAGNEWEIVWFHLSRRGRWESLARDGPVIKTCRSGVRLATLAEFFCEDIAAGKGPEVALLAELLARELARALGIGDQQPSALEGRLRAALRAVEENPGYAWSVHELARLAHVSTSHLHRLARDHWGAPPMRAVTRVRQERAAALLRHTELTLAQIAEMVGYSDAFAFSSAFRRWNGRSPSEFRRIRNGLP